MRLTTSRVSCPHEVFHHLGEATTFYFRLEEYDRLFTTLEITPIGDRRILDAGCGNGRWLDICCKRWGALQLNCVGNDKRDSVWIDWHRSHTKTEITFIHKPTEELSLAPQSFNIIHQSMMLSSVVNRKLRERTAQMLWRLLAPGGLFISYDLWLDPLNPQTVGITKAELLRLFPKSRSLYERSLTLAPPISRSLSQISDSLPSALEQLQFLNTHRLVALQRPENDFDV